MVIDPPAPNAPPPPSKAFDNLRQRYLWDNTHNTYNHDEPEDGQGQVRADAAEEDHERGHRSAELKEEENIDYLCAKKKFIALRASSTLLTASATTRLMALASVETASAAISSASTQLPVMMA